MAKHLKLDLSSTSRGKFTNNENIILIDDTLSVLCSYDNPNTVNPPPSLKLFMVQRNSGHNAITITQPILMAKGGIDRFSPSNKFIGFNQLKATKKINREDMGRYIVCECSQTFGNKEIFSNSVYSEALQIFQSPTIINWDILPETYLIDDSTSSSTISIPIKFAAIPRPTDKHIAWTIITGYENEFGDVERNKDSLEDDTKESYIIHPGTSIASCITDPIMSLPNDVYEANIEFTNVTENITIILEISNPYGKVEEMLPRIIVETKQNLTSEMQVMEAKGPMMWVIVLIAAILVISIMMFSFMVCIKRKNKKHQEELDEIDNNDDIKMEKSVYKKEKVVLDQNDLAFHVSEVGESKKLQRFREKKSDFNASLQDLRAPRLKKQSEITNRTEKHTKQNIKSKGSKEELKDFSSSKSNESKSNIKTNAKKDISPKNDNITPRSPKITTIKSEEIKTKTINSDSVASETKRERKSKVEPVVVQTEISNRNVTFVNEEENDSSYHNGIQSSEHKPVLRHSGPTSYPIMAPPDEDDSFKKTPSRVTSPIHFTGPSEINVPITMVSK